MTTSTTMTRRQFADWLASRLQSAGLQARVWQGGQVIRVYRDRGYVNVTTDTEMGAYGGPLSLIVGHDRGFRAALEAACESVESWSMSAATVTVLGAWLAAHAPAAAATPTAFGSVGRCGCCGRGSARGPCSLRTDASGLVGYVREECRGDFSFA